VKVHHKDATSLTSIAQLLGNQHNRLAAGASICNKQGPGSET
jgi:hypothetical protein